MERVIVFWFASSVSISYVNPFLMWIHVQGFDLPKKSGYFTSIKQSSNCAIGISTRKTGGFNFLTEISLFPNMYRLVLLFRIVYWTGQIWSNYHGQENNVWSTKVTNTNIWLLRSYINVFKGYIWKIFNI